MIRNKIFIYTLLLILCIVIPALLPYNAMIFISTMVWSVALVYFVIHILKDNGSDRDREEDQMIVP